MINLQKELKDAMKTNNRAKKEFIIGLKESLLNFKIASRKESISEAEYWLIIKGNLKIVKETILVNEKAGRYEAAGFERLKLLYLMAELPAAISGDELQNLVESSINELHAQSIRDMGRVIVSVRNKVAQRHMDVDNSELSSLIKQRLSA